MGMLDDLLSAATGGQSFGGRSQAPSGGLPAGLSSGTLAALLPIVLAMLSQRGMSQPASGGGGLGDILGQMMGGPGGGGMGGLGGLGGLLNQLERSGHAEHAQSWVGTGQNMPISPDAIGQVFGQDGLEEIARRAGLSTHEASAGLAHLLPSVIDHVTPGGQVPDGDQLAGTLQDLMRRLGG
jgi:uncharacterized protein YidB (DUF937 family)